MTRLFFIICAALAAGACKTLGFGADGPTITLIETIPAGARVEVEGFGECESPCTVELDAPRNLTIAKAGYNPKRFVLTPGKKKVAITLELSAPTTGVDETELPEL